jgi:hypothetical protein
MECNILAYIFMDNILMVFVIIIGNYQQFR